MYIFWGLLLILLLFILYNLIRYLANSVTFKKSDNKNGIFDLQNLLTRFKSKEKEVIVSGAPVKKEGYENIKGGKDSVEPLKSRILNSGYCFVGKVGDARRCAKVTENDECMSGHIYPTKDICINPNLVS